jgi:hypothetical protein
MNPKSMTLAIATMVASVALTALVFAVPQQALVYRNHHNSRTSIKVDQQIGQPNVCTGSPPADSEDDPPNAEERVSAEESTTRTVCLNTGTTQLTFMADPDAFEASNKAYSLHFFGEKFCKISPISYINSLDAC